jgi:hypothetical protein
VAGPRKGAGIIAPAALRVHLGPSCAPSAALGRENRRVRRARICTLYFAAD